MKLTLLTITLGILATQLATGNIWIIIATFLTLAVWALDIRKFFIK